jgi:hypothetical protein
LRSLYSAARACGGRADRGQRRPVRTRPDLGRLFIEDHFLAQDFAAPADDARVATLTDPGPLPAELLRIPGWVSEVMDYCVETARYPNEALALCGAGPLEAFLAGRKVRDQADNRTNIFLLGLAFSSVGKDWLRKINTQVLRHVGLAGRLGDHFASGEGIAGWSVRLAQHAVPDGRDPDGLLQTMSRSRRTLGPRDVMSTLLRECTRPPTAPHLPDAAGGLVAARPAQIDQPCLIVYGTAIPTHYGGCRNER